jgi:hypothetical protein
MCRNFPGHQPAAPPQDPQPAARGTPAKIPRGNWQPQHPIRVQYRNFQEREQTLTAEADSCRRQKNHISLLVAPTGRRITLRRDRIDNLAEIEAHCAQRVAPGQDWPTPRERQVLNYHKKHKSTSPLYEKIRAKYPDW